MSGIVASGLYALLGIIVPIAIDKVPSMSTLAFRDYSAGYKVSERPWWTLVIEYLIVLFPALDVFSAFPLTTISSNDNII